MVTFVTWYFLSIVWFIRTQGKWQELLCSDLSRNEFCWTGVKLKTYVGESFTTSLKHTINMVVLIIISDFNNINVPVFDIDL